MTALDGCQSRGVTEPQRDGGSRKADGEGVHDGFLVVTFDYVNKRFAVHQAFSSGRRHRTKVRGMRCQK